MQADYDFNLIRFHVSSIHTFHAILAALGRCFEGGTGLQETSEVGLALCFLLVGTGEVILLDNGPVYHA